MISPRQSFEYTRKSVHLLSLFVPLIAYYSITTAQLILLFFVGFYLFAEWRKVTNRPLKIQKYISTMHRESELTHFAKAPLLLAIGILVAITFFSWKAALIGIYQVGLCDTLAALCGKKWGVTKLPLFERKTIIGSIAFFFAALPIGFLMLPSSKAIVIALFGAFLESLPFKDWDNFTIPIAITFLAEHFLFW